jgi:hypothetical protein
MLTFYITDEPTIYRFRGFIGGVMVSVLVSKVVDRGLIGGVLFSILVSKAVDRGFIGGGLRCLSRKRYRDKNANHYPTDEPTIYRSRDKNANLLHH